ncbi:pilus assembly protein [Pseudomonadota bacterium]
MNKKKSTIMHKRHSVFYTTAFTCILLLTLQNSSYAAPSDSPLPLVSPALPNIFFLNDDSSTMDAEVLTSDLMHDSYIINTDDSRTPAFIQRVAPYYQGNKEETITCVTTAAESDGKKYGPTNIEDTGSVLGYTSILETKTAVGEIEATEPCDVVSEMEWRARLHKTNPLYFNPDPDALDRYNPWPGKDPNGKDNKSYQDFEVSDDGNHLYVLIDPAIKEGNAGYEKIDLFNDSAELTIDSDGNVERKLYTKDRWTTWCKKNDQILLADCKGWRYYTHEDTNGNDKIDSSELQVHWVKKQTPEIQKRFANWFSYHRSRKFVARYALGKAIVAASEKKARIGLGGVNDVNDVVKKKVSLGTQKFVLIDDHSASHQDVLLEQLYKNRASDSSGTGLQFGLQWVGEYYNAGISDAATDPVSPIKHACQINNTIMLTDGFYTDDLSGGKIFKQTDTTIEDEDNNSQPHTLADIAQYYWGEDLNKDDVNFPDEVPKSDTDSQTQQHMNTYTVAFGLAGNATLDDANSKTYKWQDPEAGVFHGKGFGDAKMTEDIAKARIDDLLHAAKNGRGQYLNASKPSELIDTLEEIVRTLAKGRQLGTNSIGNSSFFLDAEGQIFVSSFDPIEWTGELKAFKASTDVNAIKSQDWTNAPSTWEASNKLPAEADRNIFTFNSDNDKAVLFKWADIGATNQSSLSSDLVSYIRGGEGPKDINGDYTFRERKSLLGDIVGSTPKYVGPPPLLYGDVTIFGDTDSKTKYQTFWEKYNGYVDGDLTKRINPRPPHVYVGANDGMLHAFDATSGVEQFAYIPQTVIPKLHNLSKKTAFAHKFFVDQTPTITDAFFEKGVPKASSINQNWHTVLASGLGAGGRGIFALDISDPANFTKAEETVLWEFNNSNDSDFGYSLAEPIIVPLETGRWAVITGNGPDSDNGNAALFIIYLDANPANWTLSDNSKSNQDTADYVKITIPGTNNGLFSPAAVDVSGNGLVDRVYAGDLEGNLWAFNLSDADTSDIDGLSWGVAHIDGTAKPMFKTWSTETEKTSHTYPITAKPVVVRNKDASTSLLQENPELVVFFGTGKYYDPGDNTVNSDTQSFYAVLDNDGTGNKEKDDLLGRKLTSGDITRKHAGADVTVKARSILPKDGKAPKVDFTSDNGWYLELTPNERVFTEAVFFQETIFFNTYTPLTTAKCGGGGESWLMFLDAWHGFNPKNAVVNTNSDDTIDSGDVADLTPDDKTKNPTTISGLQLGEFEGALSSPTVTNESVVVSTTTRTIAIEHSLGKSNVSGKRISWKELKQ